MNKIEINQKSMNKIIAFKMLEILHDNGLMEEKKYVSIKQKRMQYGEKILKQKNNYKGGESS